MSSNCSALKYSRDFSFLNVFDTVGDAINVYIPSEIILADFPPIAESIVFGSRPYSVQSDIVAIIAHMGILFPSEKQKKSAPNFLYTYPNALKIQPTDKVTHEDSQRIDDDFHFYGVVVTVIASPPLDSYKASTRLNISSHPSNDPGPFSLDIVDYHFVSEFEPIPDLTEDPLTAKFHYDDIEERFYQETDDLDFIYSPQYFKSSVSEILFRDFKITFIVDSNRFTFVAEQPNSISIYKDDGDSTTLMQKDVALSQIEFGENNINISGNNLSPVSKVLLESKN